jgi:hypothetical protein
MLAITYKKITKNKGSRMGHTKKKEREGESDEERKGKL